MARTVQRASQAGVSAPVPRHSTRFGAPMTRPSTPVRPPVAQFTPVLPNSQAPTASRPRAEGPIAPSSPPKWVAKSASNKVGAGWDDWVAVPHRQTEVARAKIQPVTSVSVPLAQKVAAGYTCQVQNDVKLVFANEAGPALVLWASSELLASVSPFYRDMLASGMHESLAVSLAAPSTESAKRKADEGDEATSSATAPSSTAEWQPDQPGDDSDTEADNVYRSHRDSAVGPEPAAGRALGELAHKRVEVKHARHATYCAFLAWLQTGRIVFAPLKSAFATSAARIAPLRQTLTKEPHAPMPVSAKSVYRLANYLDIPSLSRIALDTYLGQIDVRCAAQEVFGPMLSFPEAKARLVSFMEVNRDAFKRGDGLEEVRAKLNRGEFDGIEKEVIEVLIGVA